MVWKVVRIVNQPKTIKMLADPVRREILRQLRHEPQTQTQLARRLNINKPSLIKTAFKMVKDGETEHERERLKLNLTYSQNCTF